MGAAGAGPAPAPAALGPLAGAAGCFASATGSAGTGHPERVLALSAPHGEPLRADPGVIDAVAGLAFVAADFHRCVSERTVTYRIRRVSCKAAVSDSLAPEKLTEQGCLLESAGGVPPVGAGALGGADGAQGEERVGAEGRRLEEACLGDPPGGLRAGFGPRALVVPASRRRRKLGWTRRLRTRWIAAGNGGHRSVCIRDFPAGRSLRAARGPAAALVRAGRVMAHLFALCHGASGPAGARADPGARGGRGGRRDARARGRSGE